MGALQAVRREILQLARDPTHISISGDQLAVGTHNATLLERAGYITSKAFGGTFCQDLPVCLSPDIKRGRLDFIAARALLATAALQQKKKGHWALAQRKQSRSFAGR